MAKPPAPQGWKRLSLPAPSSRHAVFSFLGVPPPPAPNRTPKTRRGVEANVDSYQLPSDPRCCRDTADGRYRLNHSSVTGLRGPPWRCDFADCPRRSYSCWLCCDPGHRSSRILQRNKKASPSPPKNAETSSLS